MSKGFSSGVCGDRSDRVVGLLVLHCATGLVYSPHYSVSHVTLNGEYTCLAFKHYLTFRTKSWLSLILNLCFIQYYHFLNVSSCYKEHSVFLLILGTLLD